MTVHGLINDNQPVLYGTTIMNCNGIVSDNDTSELVGIISSLSMIMTMVYETE